MADDPRKWSHIRKLCDHHVNIGMFTVDNAYPMVNDNAVDYIRSVSDFDSGVEYTKSYVKYP